MTTGLQKRDSDEPQSGRASDVASTGSGMIVGDVHGAEIRSPVTPDRRLRNWLLLANVVAWVMIIVAVRWLFL